MEDDGSVHADNVGDVNDFQNVDWNQVGSTGAIWLPPID